MIIKKTSEERQGWQVIDPLETLKALLEKRYKEHQEDDIKTIIILLKLFETEDNIRDYVKDKMTLCQMHGLCAKVRGKQCQDFSAQFMPYEQECEYCEYQEEIQ